MQHLLTFLTLLLLPFTHAQTPVVDGPLLTPTTTLTQPTITSIATLSSVSNPGYNTSSIITSNGPYNNNTVTLTTSTTQGGGGGGGGGGGQVTTTTRAGGGGGGGAASGSATGGAISGSDATTGRGSSGVLVSLVVVNALLFAFA